MNLIELNQALKQLRLGGMAAVLETRLQQVQAEAMAPIDLISCLVTDELTRRGDRSPSARQTWEVLATSACLFRSALRHWMSYSR